MKGKTSVLSVYAKSRAKTNAEARRLSVSELEKLIANLSASLAAEKAKLQKKEAQERMATIQKVNDLLAESGLKPEDLKKAPRKAKTKAKGAAAAKRGKKAKVPPRYRLEVDGQEYLWSGRGRTPRIFQEYFDAGNSRESCEIAA